MTPQKITEGPLPYLLYAPETAAKLPLILFLHGSGERGSDLDRVTTQGLPQILTRLPEPTFVVAPQCPADSWWTPQLDALSALLNTLFGTLPVDRARVYLTGLSMGGYGAWELALKTPERFAALVPICGGGSASPRHGLEELPIWAFHGADDNVVPLSESERMVEAVNRAGGQAKLTVYPEVGHDSWTRAYSEPELYGWLFRQRQAGT